MLELNKQYFESNLETMKRMEDNSIDLIPTDPPYGYSFMGKDWDKAVPSVETWKECWRILKPGSFMFVMSAPRQDVLSHMIVNLDKAGFDTSFTSIYWAYASGFPKAMDMAKAIDKKFGLEGETTNQKTYPDMRSGNYGNSEGKTRLSGGDYYPEAQEAQEAQGSYAGFQPKPAIEIIIVVMKPLSEKSYTDQFLNNGKGVTWLDNCRVPVNPEVDEMKRETARNKRITETWDKGSGFKNENNGFTGVDPEGRFPANILVSDDILNDGITYKGQQGATTGEEPSAKENGKVYGDYTGVSNPHIPRNDEGSFSRYFDVDKWWEERISKLPKNIQEVFPFLITPKAAKSEKNFGLEGRKENNIPYKEYRDNMEETKSSVSQYPDGTPRPMNKTQNNHPTVKPIKLMSYLITLGSREGDVIYEPYSGSATTLISAHLLGRKWIGSESDKDYYEIGQGRLLPFIKQMSLF